MPHPPIKSESRSHHITEVREFIDEWLTKKVAVDNPSRTLYADTMFELSKAYANRGKHDRLVTEDDLAATFKSVVDKLRRRPENIDVIRAFRPLYAAIFHDDMPSRLGEILTAPAQATQIRR